MGINNTKLPPHSFNEITPDIYNLMKKLHPDFALNLDNYKFNRFEKNILKKINKLDEKQIKEIKEKILMLRYLQKKQKKLCNAGNGILFTAAPTQYEQLTFKYIVDDEKRLYDVDIINKNRSPEKKEEILKKENERADFIYR